MTDILIKHATVITMDPERRVIEDGAIAVAEDRIEAVGTTEEVSRGRSPTEVIDATRMACLPGLIDCHAHAGHGLVKSLGTGTGDAWGEACRIIYGHASTERFWAAEAALAGLERLKAGITCGVSLLGGGDDIHRSDHPAYGTAYCRTIESLGTRAVLAVGPGRPPYPHRFTRLEEGAEERAVSFEQELAVCEALIEGFNRAADGRLRVALVTPVYHGNEDLDGAGLSELKRMAEAVLGLRNRHDLLLTQDGHREGSLDFCDRELGYLGPWALMSHAVDLTERDMAACQRTGARIVHNPSAIRSITGRCPVPELLEMGVTVVLGSDAAAPDRGYDMFRHMAQCMHYHRRHFRDPRVLPPGKVLEMTTIDAARALGVEKEIGSIEPGKKADVILLDLFKPHLVPINMPLIRTVHYANAADVDSVIVDGRILMRGRKVESLDEVSVLEEAERETAIVLERSGLAHLTREPASFWHRSGLSRAQH
jgi:cytosine/adenosine deaminase-related metal-dependent hydrolase